MGLHNGFFQLLGMVAAFHKDQNSALIRGNHRLANWSPTIRGTSLLLRSVWHEGSKGTHDDIFRNLFGHRQMDSLWYQWTDACYLRNWPENRKHVDSPAIISLVSSFNPLTFDGGSAFGIDTISGANGHAYQISCCSWLWRLQERHSKRYSIGGKKTKRVAKRSVLASTSTNAAFSECSPVFPPCIDAIQMI